MQLQDFLIKLISATNDWVIVTIFGIYVAYHIYKKYADGTALYKTLTILENTIVSLLKNVDRNITTLVDKIDRLTSTKQN